MLTRKALGSALSILVTLALAANATDYYVKTDGMDTAVGTNWAFALQTISNAVFKAAASGGGTVTVSNGSYRVSAGILVTTGIVIRSDNNGSPDRAGTIVYGDGTLTGPVFTISNASARLEGFTITNGTARGVILGNGLLTNCLIARNVAGGTTNGAGLSMSGGTVADCVISNNNQTGTGSGGGVNFTGGSLLRCVVTKNTSAKDAAGIQMTAGTLEGCEISYNTAAGQAGGLYLGQELVVRSCRIFGNTCGGGKSGGGSYASKGGTFRNCLFAANKTGVNGTGGGISGAGANPLVLESCTIANNEASGSGKGGGVNFGGTGAIVGSATNCIVYFNTNSANPNIQGTQYCFYSCSPDLVHGSGHNITNEPMFVATNLLNYQLLAASKCIDTGVSQSWMNVAVDLGGLTRRLGVEVDMGAYEFLPASPSGTMVSIR